MNTYEDIAEKKGLPSAMKARFVMYMRKRWGDREELQCQTGYAEEWADRFLNEMEYTCSDRIGQSVLKTIDGKL